MRRLQIWLFLGVQMSQFYGLWSFILQNTPEVFHKHYFYKNQASKSAKYKHFLLSIVWDWHGQTLASNSPFGYKFDWSWAFLGYCIFKYFLQRIHTALKGHFFPFATQLFVGGWKFKHWINIFWGSNDQKIKHCEAQPKTAMLIKKTLVYF